jgi:uncharacterized protein (DUF433 family)
MSDRDIITIEPDKRGGRPCIRQMRITVCDVLGWLSAGMTTAEILDDFPELTETDIKACLEFDVQLNAHSLPYQPSRGFHLSSFSAEKAGSTALIRSIGKNIPAAPCPLVAIETILKTILRSIMLAKTVNATVDLRCTL